MNYLTVLAGTNSLSYGGDIYHVDKTVGNPGFNQGSLHYDVGLIKVKTPIKFNDKVKPIELNTEDIGVGADLVISGWGSGDKLQFINLKSISNSDCNQSYTGTGLTIIDSQICTLAKDGEGPCYGDSGSPLAYNGKVAGIVSFGRCDKSYPDVFTRVSELIDWIDNGMKTN